MSKWYGNVSNRIEEGRNYNKDKSIHEGDDITMYYYSDRTCFFVTKVLSQKHIFVHRYEVCADHEKEGGMGHQNWLYFKTIREEQEYLSKFFPERKENLDKIKEHSDEEWVFRYNSWYQVFRRNLERWNHALQLAKEDLVEGSSQEKLESHARFLLGLTEEEVEQIKSGKEIVKYYKISQKISIGVRDYYYDWEF